MRLAHENLIVENKKCLYERQNCVFEDPHTWVGRMSYNDPAKWPDHAELIAQCRKPLADLDLDLLERQAVVALRNIPRGTELLIDYRRWGG